MAQNSEIENYVRINLIPATPGVGCFDPRPAVKSADENKGETRTPGGDFGYSMALMAALPSLSPEQSISLVSDWARESQKRLFSMHTDNHAEGPEDLGCGHIRGASEIGRESLYGVSSRKIMDAYRAAMALPQKRFVVLSGESCDANGALVILGDTDTVNPNDGEQMYYRLDYSRTMKNLDDLAQYIYSRGIRISFGTFRASFQKQTDATLSFLAEGKPKYNVDLTFSTSPRVVLLGTI